MYVLRSTPEYFVSLLPVRAVRTNSIVSFLGGQPAEPDLGQQQRRLFLGPFQQSLLSSS